MSFTSRLVIITLLLIGPLAGCKPKPTIRPGSSHSQGGKLSDPAGADQFVETAFNYLKDLDRYEPTLLQAKILQPINNWFKVQQLDPNWRPDPMLAELPESIRSLPRLQDLATRRFLEQPPTYQQFTFRGSEFDFIEGTYWTKVISNWIRETKVPPPEIQAFLNAQVKQDALTKNEAANLGLAYLLFDWTVRHIQPIRDNAFEQDVFQPGTSRDTWDALQLNQGDKLERARVFIQLCRQQGLDAVLVEFGKDKPIDQVVGVAIGDKKKELFLFDIVYALPISTADGTGITTLSRLNDHPEDLQAMASKNYKYPVTADQLQEVTLLIEAPSTSLTQAASLLENVLSGDLSMKVQVQPSLIKEQLSGLKGVSEIKLWTVPFEAEEAIGKRLAHPELRNLFQVERLIYDVMTPFSTGRILQLLCRFKDEGQRLGARNMFLRARILDREIQQAVPSQRLEMLRASGMDISNNPREQQLYLDNVMRTARMWRELSTFNLGVIALSDHQFESAIFFFDDGTLKEFPQTIFKSAAYYGAARSYEALAREKENAEMAQKAYDFYTDENDVLSPYRRGNLLRAERLPFIEKAEKPAEEKPEAKPAAEDTEEKKPAEEPSEPEKMETTTTTSEANQPTESQP